MHDGQGPQVENRSAAPDGTRSRPHATGARTGKRDTWLAKGIRTTVSTNNPHAPLRRVRPVRSLARRAVPPHGLKPATIVDALPVQPADAPDHQLLAPDQGLSLFPCSVSPAGGTRRSASKNHALTSANAGMKGRESVSLTPALFHCLSASTHHLRYTRHTHVWTPRRDGRTALLPGCQHYTVSSVTPHPPIGPIVPIVPASPGPPVRPVSARRTGGAGRTGGTGAAWRTGRAHLDAVRLELDVPCPHIVDLHLMGDERGRLCDKRDDQGGTKPEGAPLKQFLFYVSHVVPHAT